MAKYPGLGLPLRHFLQGGYNLYPTGIHGSCFGGDSTLLPVREVAMMNIMDKLMDKKNCQKKVFDDGIIAKWRKEALEFPDDLLWKQAVGGKVNSRWAGQNDDNADRTMSHFKPLKDIMSNEAFNYCIQELRNKARYYEKSGLIPTLNACATVVKSDILVSPELQHNLCNAFEKLKTDQKTSPDWHPDSGDMVQNLLHPSMYPLVYGRSRVLSEEVVGVSDAIEKWARKGKVVAKDSFPIDRRSYGIGGSGPPPSFWSDTYQWLPSNVSFQDDGSVKFTSYINNLHPNRYPDIHRTIEKLVERALPAWDQCFILLVGYDRKTGAGRVESRFFKPENADDENPENWDPSDPQAVADMEVNSDELDAVEVTDDQEMKKWYALRKPVQPQLVPLEDSDDYYIPKESQRLSEKFKDSGLQIIVKMTSIELTPKRPSFPAGGWHVEGQMNERICATAIYYLDSENITFSDLSFRMQTSAYMNDEYDVGQDAYFRMEQIYGTSLGGNNSPCLQNYGSVETRKGRLLAFPNVFHHRVSPFRLADPTKPGHRRFIALWLVDPHVRIISNANVPPQQQDWWVESIFSLSSEAKSAALSKLPVELVQLLKEKGLATDLRETEKGKLPLELIRMVREYFDTDKNILLMNEEEAKKHREKLMGVRTAFSLEADDNWHEHSYSFCEH